MIDRHYERPLAIDKQALDISPYAHQFHPLSLGRELAERYRSYRAVILFDIPRKAHIRHSVSSRALGIDIRANLAMPRKFIRGPIADTIRYCFAGDVLEVTRRLA